MDQRIQERLAEYEKKESAKKSPVADQSTPANPPPNGDKRPDDDSDIHEGLKPVPDDWSMVESETARVKSEPFKRFLREHGFNPKKWVKVMEKYGSPDGNIYQRHYWTDGTHFFYHGEGIEIFIPH